MPSDRRTGAPAGEGTNQSRRLDASMSMLTDLLQERIEDDYRAARRLRVGSPHAARPKLGYRVTRRVAFFAVLVICALFATSGARQLVSQAPQAAADHEALVEEAQDSSARVVDLERRLVKTRRQHEKAQRRALAQDTRGAQRVRELKALQDSTGYNAVRGAGVSVTVDDAESEDVHGETAGGKILDRDLQVLVNGLWAAGAEAISINGQRLTALTAIREAGDAVLVDYRPLARPYHVRAMGDPNSLQASFAEGAAGDYFKTLQASFDVRFEMEEHDELSLPAASTVTLEHARRGEHP